MDAATIYSAKRQHIAEIWLWLWSIEAEGGRCLSIIQKQTPRAAPVRTKPRVKRIRLWCLWVILLLAGFWVTRIDVRSVSPPPGLLETVTLSVPPSPPQTDIHSGIAPQTPAPAASAEVTMPPEELQPSPEPPEFSPSPMPEPTPAPSTSVPPAVTASPEAEPSATPQISGTISTPTPSASPNLSETGERVARYADLEISDEELADLVAIVYLEAGTESLRGQQAVAEVILNRVIADNFSDSVHDVIYQGIWTSTPQFSTAPYILTAEPTESQYLAVEQALCGPSILPDDVVYFSLAGENAYVWGTIENHIFCYQYPWAVSS